MLTGPIDATQRLFERTGLGVDDIDVAEINEAFASVVLAWQKELGFTRRADQPQRRRHRPRPPARRHRRGAAHQGPPRAGAHRRPLRPRVDVLRRRPRHRHHHRAPLGARLAGARRPTSRRSQEVTVRRALALAAHRLLLRRAPPAASARCTPTREPAPPGTARGRAARRRRHDRRRHRRRRRSRCGSSASTRPSRWRPDRPVECFGPEAKARTAELLPGGHRSCASSATSRPATATTGCSPT